MLTTAANNALANSVTVTGSVEASARGGDVWLTGMAATDSGRTRLSTTWPG